MVQNSCGHMIAVPSPDVHVKEADIETMTTAPEGMHDMTTQPSVHFVLHVPHDEPGCA